MKRGDIFGARLYIFRCPRCLTDEVLEDRPGKPQGWILHDCDYEDAGSYVESPQSHKRKRNTPTQPTLFDM